MRAQDCRGAHGLLYLTAVWDDWREQERCQGRVDIGLVSLTAPEAMGHQRVQLHQPLCSPDHGPRLVHVADEVHNGWKGQVRPIPENCVACLRKANQAGRLGREIAG